MTVPRIVGLAGYSRVGKDTVGRFFTDRHGYRRAALADRGAALLMHLNPWVDVATGLVNADGKDIVRWVRLAELVRRQGWENAKDVPEVRRQLQMMMEGGRTLVAEDIWLFAMLRVMDPEQNWVITDVRFPNEVDAIHNSKGMVIRVSRPGYGPVNGHVSESFIEQLDVDLDLGNTGSVDDLSQAVDDIMAAVTT